MTTVNIYLNFDGNCEEAFNFYRQAFGTEFTYMGRYKDMPAEEGQPPMSEQEANRIMHVGLPVGAGTMLMGADSGGPWADKIVQGNNFAISINTDSQAEADRLFGVLGAGGNVTMPMQLTFWGDYFGMFTDKFGISWMVSFSTKAPQA